MPLIVEDGTGVSNADSYVSRIEADAYHAARGNDVWATLSEDKRDQLLRRAADYITHIFGRGFLGQRAYAGQALAWPRRDIRNRNLLTLAVPREVREAKAALALIASTTPPLPSVTAMRKQA